MNLFQIAFRSLRQRALSTVLTMTSVALGVGLIVAVLVIYGVVNGMFSQTGSGFDLLVGPKGSATQLVLSTIYRIENPSEPLPYRYYTELKSDPRVERAVPMAVGDSTEEGGFKIVGTTSDFFLLPYARDGAGQPKKFRFSGKNLLSQWDAMIGSEVAVTNGWNIGSEFKMVHGGQSVEEGGHVHDEKFTVRGVLAPTGTPNDRSVFVNLRGFFAIDGHDKPIAEAIQREAEFFPEDGEAGVRLRYAEEIAAIEASTGHYHGPMPDLQKEISAILLTMSSKGKSAFAAQSRSMQMRAEINEGFKSMAVSPVQVMTKLINTQIGDIKNVMLLLTALIVVVSANGIFVSIYNSMADRRREIGIMRALGARRATMLGIILAETALLCIGGGLIGFFTGHALVFFSAPWITAKYGLMIDPWHFEWVELTIFPVLIVLAIIVGILPGLTAYRTDVASALSD